MRALNMHLIAVGQFEENGEGEKVARHMESFMLLLDQQYANDQITNHAYEMLNADADDLFRQWK